MAGDQRISQAFKLLTPAVQTLESRMGTIETQVQQATQSMQNQAASALPSGKHRIFSQEQQHGQAVQAMKDAINQLQASQTQVATFVAKFLHGQQADERHAQQQQLTANGVGNNAV